ncbi:hypothetical protein C7H19_15480 [Aphanothece hegewaldii CCALA 016]|uniref:HTH cro/C1-type domain-containing protein n=1 Tax=Aphanothece hegewaldii CCALA 016 TaxID=2107694 RepID=A0A2T1LVS6_9CHRO|nr:helix-turn-helix transcriptional regulator [Aphanothece hegewaldii]PSF35823.1 hypothetical protein C7H19_15480 [Aphanothece hegewaldii CCALA 016]
MPEKHNIRCRLQEWIDEADENYSTIAQAVGISVGAVRRLAKNQFERVDCSTWETICDYFKKPLGDLFYRDVKK